MTHTSPRGGLRQVRRLCFAWLLPLLLACWPVWAQAGLVKSPRFIAGTSSNACWQESLAFTVEARACDPAVAAQQFQVTACPGGAAAGYYCLRAASGRCVGVRSATITTPAEQLQTRLCTASTQGDWWKPRRLAGQTNFKLQSRLGTLVAGIQANPAAGSVVDMYSDESSDTQDWSFVEHVNRARATDSAVRTTTGKAYNAPLSGQTVLPTAEADLSDCAGLVCRVAGSSPARYAPAKAFVPGMVGADLVDSIAIEETSPPISVTVATAAAISGQAIENQTLTLTPGTFNNYTGAVLSQLLRGGTVIATGVTSYTLTAADVGQVLVYRSTASSVVTSASTATVVAAATGGNTWTGGIVTAAFSGLQTVAGPIVATTGQVIEGKSISSTTGSCIIIPLGVSNVTVRANNIGPCERTSFDNGDGAGIGVHIRGGGGALIEANYFRDVANGVVGQGVGPIRIQRNTLHNIYGGNLVAGGSRYLPGIQFNGMTGSGGRSLVACNVMDSSTWTITPTSTRPGIEDGFSTNGSSNVTYRYNKLRGDPAHGYNSATGSCISLGDDAGNNNQARDNVCVKTPNNGIFTAGGDNQIIENNLVFNTGVAGSNTALSYGVGEFQGQQSSGVLVRGNRGYATNWQNGNTGSVDAWASFWTWVSGRDGAPDRTVDNLVMYGNAVRDTTLTESGVWSTTWPECAGTAAIPSGDITFPQVTQTVPLFSTVTNNVLPYPWQTAAGFQGKNKFVAINGLWTANGNGGVNALTAAGNVNTWSQGIGIEGLQPNHTVNVRFKWSYPKTYGTEEVLNYPGICEGRCSITSDATTSAPKAGAKLPVLISSITSYRSGYASAAGPATGPAQLSYDLWGSDTPTSTSIVSGVEHRIFEIMLPTRVSGAYNIPNSPTAATVGRNCTGIGTAATTCRGHNPNTYQGRFTVGGVLYDVYWAPPNSPYTGLRWNFIEFIAVSINGTGPHTIDWKPILDFIAARGWIPNFNALYLNANELGIEAINPSSYDLPGGGTTGDWQVMGYWTELNGARY